MERLTIDKLNTMILDVENWKRCAYEFFYQDDSSYGYGFSKGDDNRIYYGPVGWAGDSLDGFGFDMCYIKSKAYNNANEIIEDVKNYIADHTDNSDDLINNGLYVEEYCGWEEYL